MAGEPFDAPRVRLNRIVTKTGDEGMTSLVGGQRVGKDSSRIQCAGAVDELNAFTGLARVSAAPLPELEKALLRVQHQLFNLGSLLATRQDDAGARQAKVTADDVESLDAAIEQYNAGLPELRSFVLPGSSRLDAELHACRTICRRAERECVRLAREEPLDPEAVRYLNRLSDAFFVWSRWANHRMQIAATLWDPNL